jgi:Uncharacterized protein conserved in bacteria
MADPEIIRVEVAYARPDKQCLISVDVGRDATVEQAIFRSGILTRFPEIDLKVNKVGVFGKLTKLSNPLHAGDRIEILRPLIADPKETRKRRALGQARGGF